MIKAYPRTRRIGEQIRRELAELIRDELRDPRLTLISMTSVDVSRDLAHARVYVTFSAIRLSGPSGWPNSITPRRCCDANWDGACISAPCRNWNSATMK